MSVIDIVTFITDRCAPYADLLRKSCEEFKSGKHHINYLGILTNNKCDKWPQGWRKRAKTLNYNHGSINHAVAIHEAFRRVTGDIIVLVDCDVCFLRKDFDRVITKRLCYDDAFGGGYSDYNTNKFFNFPAPHLFCFKKELLDKVNLNFMPNVKKKSVEKWTLKEQDHEAARAFGKKCGETVKLDTGWMVPLSFWEKSLTAYSMKMIYHFQDNAILPFSDDKDKGACIDFPMQQSEWHYKGKIFATHKQSVTQYNHTWNSVNGRLWKKRIDMYTQKEYGLTL